MNTLKRSLVGYRKDDDRIAVTYDITHLPLDLLREVANAPEDDPEIIYEYDLLPEKAAVFEKLLKIKLDLERHNYQLSVSRQG